MYSADSIRAIAGLISRIGKNWEYETAFTIVLPHCSESSKMARLSHYPNGPALDVECCEFFATNENQIRVVRKTSSGWHWLKTSAYCLTEPSVDISSYVQDCVPFAIEETCRGQEVVGFFFNLSRSFQDVRSLLEVSKHILIYTGANHTTLPRNVHDSPFDEDRVAVFRQ